MSKNTLAVITAIAALSVLAGCSAAPASKTTAETSSSAPAAHKLVAEQSTPTPPATSNPDWGKYTQDEFYIKSVEANWPSGRPADDQLISDAHAACADLKAGTDRKAVAVVGDDAELPGNVTVVTYAIQVYCPEFAPKR